MGVELNKRMQQSDVLDEGTDASLVADDDKTDHIALKSAFYASTTTNQPSTKFENVQFQTSMADLQRENDVLKARVGELEQQLVSMQTSSKSQIEMLQKQLVALQQAKDDEIAQIKRNLATPSTV